MKWTSKYRVFDKRTSWFHSGAHYELFVSDKGNNSLHFVYVAPPEGPFLSGSQKGLFSLEHTCPSVFPGIEDHVCK